MESHYDYPRLIADACADLPKVKGHQTWKRQAPPVVRTWAEAATASGTSKPVCKTKRLHLASPTPPNCPFGVPIHFGCQLPTIRPILAPALHLASPRSPETARLEFLSTPFQEAVPPKEVHLDVWSAVNLQRRLSEIVHNAVLVWYTSNTKANRKGAIMAYVFDGSGYDTWYASLTAEGTWRTEKTKGITKDDFDTLLENAPQGDAKQTDATDGASPRR